MAVREDMKDRKDKPKTVTIRVNNRKVKLPDRKVSGLEIKQAAGVPEHFHLYGPKGDEIDNDELVRIRDDQRFTAISGQDVS